MCDGSASVVPVLSSDLPRQIDRMQKNATASENFQSLDAVCFDLSMCLIDYTSNMQADKTKKRGKRLFVEDELLTVVDHEVGECDSKRV